MNPEKSLFTKIIELIGQHRAEQHQKQVVTGTAIEQPIIPKGSKFSYLTRWLPTPGNVLFTLLVAGFLVMTQRVWAIPNLANAPGASATTINHQGRLEDSNGNPLNGPEELEFAIYDRDTGGDPVWGPETHDNTPVKDGLFSVGLGSRSGGIPPSIWNGDRYLQTTVNNETLLPRELIRSVPIAGMALTVPDRAITSDKLQLQHRTACLSRHTDIDLPGGRETEEIPGIKLTFRLSQQSSVLVWVDGLAKPYGDDGQVDLSLAVNGERETGDLQYMREDQWFNVNGSRLLTLDPGNHTITLEAGSPKKRTIKVHGWKPFQTCINYMVLGGAEEE